MNEDGQVAIEQQIKQGESQALEFKKSLSLTDKGLETLCAMVNSNFAQGTVIFGIDRDGNICGLDEGNLDTSQRSLAQTIRQKFEPNLMADIQIKEIGNKKVLVLHAERRGNIGYYEYDGRAWIREGTSNRKLSLVEKQQLLKMRNRDYHTGPWKCDQCGSWVGQLISVELTNEGMKKTYKCDCGGEFWPVT